jgi:hypothetical protein
MNTSSFVSDALWEAIEPLLPIEPPKLKSVLQNLAGVASSAASTAG